MTWPPFDLAGPLPTGVTVLQASAGTGKTYAIAGLVARYVADGVRLPELLVVTFSRPATAELRDRVRGRLVSVARHLDAVLAGATTPTDDDVARVLAAGPRDAVRLRHRRLEAALGEFDAATVATIHGFCQQVLAGIGLAGDVDRAATLLHDQAGLVEAVVDDLLVRTYAAGGGAPVVTRRELLELARAVVANPDATVVPHVADDTTVAVRVRLACAVRDEVDRRKRRARLLSYDDLLTRLAATLADPRQGPVVRRRLREKYAAVLIDEFQDTDPVQWRIVSDAFGGDDRPLVLIGDPKQAIYAFRGADVCAYLAAAQSAQRRATLAVNWRSDGPLLRAFDRLFDRATLGSPEIAYRPVAPAPGREASGLSGAPRQAPLRVRVVRRDCGVRLTGSRQSKTVVADAARRHVARDLAADVVTLLRSGAQLPGDAGGSPVPIAPPHLAVLVRTNAEATLVQRTLREADVPAVINGVGSVFATPAAAEWLRLLQALERPSDVVRARAVALTAFVGWSAGRVAAADDEDWEGVLDRLHRWAGILRDRSVASLLRTVTLEERLPERLLALSDGERRLTDIDHVGELLHTAATVDGVGVPALAGWLGQRIAEAGDDLDPEERARRLESDADAVQVLTVHRSKGLEFPIVYAPYLWSCNDTAPSVPVVSNGSRRIADGGGPRGGDAFVEHRDTALTAVHGENVRLLYVAMTRARHAVVVWWVPTTKGSTSPLGRLLFCRGNNGVRTDATASLPDDDLTLQRLAALADGAGGTIAVETTQTHVELPRWAAQAPTADDLAVARFDRTIDHRWRRTSYSAITADVRDAATGSEPDEAVTDDEALPAAATAPPPPDDERAAALRGIALPLGDMPGGTAVGTAVHAVLEHSDFAAADLPSELRRHLEDLNRRSLTVGDVVIPEDRAVDGLAAAVATPLGPLAGDHRLRDVARADRLDELVFELPLGGGATPAGTVTAAAVGDLLRAHLPAGDPLAGYADRLSGPSFARLLRGYLTGSIDAVLRLPDPAGHARFAVVDYKTNRLGVAGEPLTAWDYRPAALTAAMAHGHYGLQAVLYVVALHRYLRWRVAGYDPATDIGGVFYLFVRGMTGADVPRADGQPFGVFSWQPPAALIVALSDLLDGAGAAA